MAQLTESKWEKSLTFTPLTKMTSLKDENQRWALWLIALGCDEQSAKAYLRSLSCSNQSICNITQLIAWSEAMDEIASEQDWKLAVLRLGKTPTVSWITMVNKSGLAVEKAYRDEIIANAIRWMEQMPVYEVKELAINGHDLLSALPLKGPAIRTVLQKLLEQVALGKLENKKADLIAYATRWFTKGGRELES